MSMYAYSRRRILAETLANDLWHQYDQYGISRVQEHMSRLRGADSSLFIVISRLYHPTAILNMSLVGTHSGRSSPTLFSIAANDSKLPPLPEIRSKQLSRRVFTCSVGHKHSFQVPSGDASVDNEE